MRSCLRRTNGVQVPLVGAGAQIGEAAATSATKIISSHGCEDSCMKKEQRRAFAGERKCGGEKMRSMGRWAGCGLGS